MRIVFLGTPLFAKEILEGLIKNHNILATITQPDKPFGRKKILKAPEVKECAISHNIPCFQPEKGGDIIHILRDIDTKQGIEVVVVVAYGKILSKEIVTHFLCLNLHGSLLPHYRGASPIQTSIMNDYRHFGLSVICMDEGLDSGDIAALESVEKESVANKNLEEVFHILAPRGITLLEKVLKDIQTNTLRAIPQEHEKASYCRKLTKQDGYIDFIDSHKCYLRFLAIGHIGIWTRYKGSILKINVISGYVSNGAQERGKILAIDKDVALIGCESGALIIESVTPQNKAKMSMKSFLQSQNLKANDILVFE